MTGLWNSRLVTVQPDDHLYHRLRDLIAAGEPLVLEVSEGFTSPDFRVGDKVTVHFDDGPGPAEITGVGPNGDNVSVKYGPGGKHSTNLGRYSVDTTRRIQHPANVTVKDD